MATGFDALAQAGVDNAQRQAAQIAADKQQQRNTIAALYLNAIQTPLPKTDDPAYKDALAKRENLMQQYVASMGPEQHASFGQHLHGLIFGEPDTATPVHGNAPEPTPTTEVPPDNTPPQSDHPFANNPVYAKIQQGLETLGNHLKAGAHPLPPPQQPDYASLSSAPTEEERKNQQAIAIEKQKGQNAVELVKAKPRPRGSVQQQRYDAIARGMGLTGYDDPNITPEQSNQIADTVRKESLAPKYMTDPSTGLVSHIVYDEQGQPHTEVVKDANGKPFGGFKPEQVRIVNGHYHYTDQVTGKVYDVPVTTETKTIFGPNVPEGKAPVSSQAPSLSSINASIAAGNAGSKKLNKKKPVSSQAPQVPGQGRVIGQTAGLLDKSDATQLTKLSEDANNKQQAYLNAKQSLEHPTATSDQELLFSWVRSNVQGAGRMTQAEFKQAANAGSFPLRIQTVIERAKTGKLPPELEQMMLADIKRSADTAQKQVNDLRATVTRPVSNQAPQVPTETPQADPALVKRLTDALGGH